MSIGNACFDHHNDHVNRRPSRRRWVGTIAATVVYMVMGDQYGRSDDAKDDPKPGTVITNSIGMKLAWIPAGEFLMGSPDSDDEILGNEKPQYRVRITRPFRLGVYEVTQREWISVVGTTPWKGDRLVKQGDRYPTTNVKWTEAVEFCQTLSGKERRNGRLPAGESYRMPTETEWEYACRAGSATRYYFGDAEGSLDNYEWFAKNAWYAGEKHAHEVGHKRRNAWGLFDMHGNVRERCSDQPREGPMRGTYRIVRGGSYRDLPRFCQSAYRYWDSDASRGDNIGFRVVRTIAPSK